VLKGQPFLVTCPQELAPVLRPKEEPKGSCSRVFGGRLYLLLITQDPGVYKTPGSFRFSFFNYSTGKVIVKVVSFPGLLSAVIVPPWASTRFLVMANPRPEEPSSGCLDLSTR